MRRHIAIAGVTLAVVIGLLAGAGQAMAQGWQLDTPPAPLVPDGRLLSVSCSSQSACTAVGYSEQEAVAGSSQQPLAERWIGTGWRVEQTPHLGGTNPELSSVSCTSSSACMAVGYYEYGPPTGSSPIFALSWNGSTWSMMDLGVPADANNDEETLTGVSCVSASDCVAVGTYDDDHGDQPLAERWNGTSWQIENVPGFMLPTGVSCSSANACMAVGASEGGASTATVSARWNGSEWTTIGALMVASNDPGDLEAVSCSSEDSCTAVGFAGGSGDGWTSGVLVEHWDGSTWSIEPTPVPADADLSDGLEGTGVSCPTANDCEALGSYEDNGHAAGLAMQWNGTSWSLQTVPDDNDAIPLGIDCVSPSSCWGVGSEADPLGLTPGALALTWNGSDWQSPPMPDTTPTQGTLQGVSCPASGDCVAVGQQGATYPFSAGFDGVSWTSENAAAAGIPTGTLAAVSCPTTTAWCMAVGTDDADVAGNSGPLAELWNGSTWTNVPTPDLSAVNGEAGVLTGISCTSSSMCIAVGYYSQYPSDYELTLAERWDGSSWTVMDTANPSSEPNARLNGIACTSATTCMAVGTVLIQDGYLQYSPILEPDYTLAESWDGSSWTLQTTTNPTANDELDAVSCPSAATCVAVGHDVAETWDGNEWTGQQLTTPPDSNGPTYPDLAGVACPSTTDCHAVGWVSHDNDTIRTSLAEAWDGANWTIENTSDPPGANNNELTGIACPSIESCMGVGYSSADEQPMLVETYSGQDLPENTAPPTITGNLAEGQTLTEHNGQWTNNPSAYEYQWEDCDSDGSDCAPIPGATGQTYTLTRGDLGSAIVVLESVSNTYGEADPVASSPTSAVTPPPAPTNQAPPTIDGVASQGQTLVEAHGRWTGSPYDFAYQWEECNASGDGCAPVSLATGSSYTLTSADVGHTIRVLETAINDGGNSNPTASVQTGLVAASSAPATKPANTSPPAIDGTAAIGRTLFASPGAWSGTAPFSYHYQWQRCSSTCSNVSGATSSSYTPTTADQGQKLRAVVTATNSAGAGTASSNEVGPVAGSQPSASAIRTALSEVLIPRGRNGTRRWIVRRGGYVTRFRSPSAGQLIIDWYQATSSHQGPSTSTHRDLVAKLSVLVQSSGRWRVKVRLTSAGQKLLRHRRRLKLDATASFTPSGGARTAERRRFVLAP